MAKIYKGNTALKITFDLDEDITNYATTFVYMYKPGGTTTTLTCTVVSASLGTMYYQDWTAGSFDTIGTYYFQPYITFATGSVAYCDTTKLRVYGPWE